MQVITGYTSPCGEQVSIRRARSTWSRLGACGKLTVPLMLDIARESKALVEAFYDARMIPGITGVGLLMRDSNGAPMGTIGILTKTETMPPETRAEILRVLTKESRVLQNMIYQANVKLAEYSKHLSVKKFV